MTPEIDHEDIDTNAGTYRVTWHYDQDADAPYDDGFTLATDGSADRRIDISHGDIPPEAAAVINTHGRGRDDTWHYDMRSGAALVRYLTIKGYKGATIVDSDYYPVELSTDRFKRVAGIAIAPHDVGGSPEAYVRLALSEWQAWAEGDTFGYEVTAPDGTVIESVWGFYGFDAGRDYTLSAARDAAECDAEDRIETSNLVGAGIVGIV